MKIELSKTAETVVTHVPVWQMWANLLTVLNQHWAKHRNFRAPPACLAFTDWADPQSSVNPMVLQPLIEHTREFSRMVSAGQSTQGMSRPVRIGEEMGLSDTGAQMVDYMDRITLASAPPNLGGLLGGEWILAPYVWGPVQLITMQSNDAYSVPSPNGPTASMVADICWRIDSPLHSMSLISVDKAMLPEREPGMIGQIQMNIGRSAMATLLVLIYRLQATLMELSVKWSWYELMATVSKEHGRNLGEEIDAMRPLYQRVMAWRHPSIRSVHGVLNNLQAMTPDGGARVLLLSPDIVQRVLANPGQWISLFAEARKLTEETEMERLSTGLQSVGQPAPSLAPTRTDILTWLHEMKPFIDQWGVQLDRLASDLWPGGGEGESTTLLFNEPPCSVTDGISAGSTATEAVFGLRCLIPITDPHLRYDIDRVPWRWSKYGLVPVEREQTPGDAFYPPDGMPRDILPISLYMGEPDAINQMAATVYSRLSDFGIPWMANAISTNSKTLWPDRPGDLRLQTPHRDPGARALPGGVRVEEEPYGPVFAAATGAELMALLEPDPGAAGGTPEPVFMCRPAGFARRAVVQNLHPQNYYHLVGGRILRQQQERLWWMDYPVTADMLRAGRPITTSVTTLLTRSFPSLSK